MTDYQRSSIRFGLSLHVQVRICDTQNLKPLSSYVDGVLLDVSTGGAKLSLAGLDEVMAQRFGPGVTLEVRTTGPEVRLSSSFYLSVAWSSHAAQANDRVKATTGGRFSSIGQEDLAALVAFARQGHHEAPSWLATLAKSWVWLLSAALLVLVLGLSVLTSRLRARVAELTEQVDSLQAQLERAPSGLELSASDEDPAPPPAPRALPSDQQLPDAGSPRVFGEGPGTPPSPSIESLEAPPGIELTSLELIGTDFVGTVVNRLPRPQLISLELSFPCEGPERCQCLVSRLRLETGRRSEVSCTPKGAMPRTPAKATIRLLSMEQPARPSP